MKKHLTIRVYGLVQGVAFRLSTKEQADSLRISGLVRNEPDGSVYIEAEGNQEDLTEFVQWCHQGPPHAKVEKCEVAEGALRNSGRFIIER